MHNNGFHSGIRAKSHIGIKRSELRFIRNFKNGFLASYVEQVQEMLALLHWKINNKENNITKELFEILFIFILFYVCTEKINLYPLIISIPIEN